MAPVNGASNKSTMGPTKRVQYPPAIPYLYSKKKEHKQVTNTKTPQPNGTLNGNGAVKPSSSENGHTMTIQPSPVESDVAVVPAAPASSLNASDDSPTVATAPNGHPGVPSVSISNAPSLNGPVHDLSPVTGMQQYPGPFPPAYHNAHPGNGHHAGNGNHPSNGHHHHPSNGHHHQLSFGSFEHGFQESTSSSPVPHLSNGFPHHQNGSVAHFDGAGHPVFMGGSNGPLTSGSFHGSQSSGLPQTLHGGNFPVTNGHGPYPIQNGHGPMSANGPMAASHLIKQNAQHEEETLAYLRSAVVTLDFTDCEIEMHFPDTHMFSDHPDAAHLPKVVRIPAHRFILARSGAILRAMHKEKVGPGGVLIFHFRDKYMRSDVVCAALRTLYGWTLSDGMPPTELALRSQRDHMLLTLCYMAVGQDLQLHWVYRYALQRAVSLFDWETIDLVVDFALPSVVLPRQSESPFNLGELMGYAMRFIIQEFPRDFVLDVSVGDGGFPRLPRSGAMSKGSSDGAAGSPMPSGQRPPNPKLQEICFGDLSAVEQNGHRDAAAPQRRAPNKVDTAVSRILLNLPYEHLKEVLETPALGGVPELARHLPIAEIIAEREARRVRALNSSDPELTGALMKAAHPLVVNGERDFHINAMGYKEEVCSGDMPFLVHTWTISPPGSEAA
ncbi:hypothetical protein QBC39DRAFT_366945 [Podospora conica]|nr:hypothetical protein QBC39DRAFT_366945 [Schizothecium conicum]